MGETPLECLERYRVENPDYRDVKMTYAGRLDPMAEGELLVLVGEECQNKEKYLGLDKEYEFDVLFGFSTDTYDILGLVNLGVAPPSFLDYDLPAGRQGLGEHREKVGEFLKNIKGKQTQKYPAFSSKTIDGKPMFELAKAGELEGREIPEKEIEIYEADFIENYWIKGEDLREDIFERISLVKGDFRQGEISERWKEVLSDCREERFLVSKIRIKCSGGTYMRAIVQNLGGFLGIPALALRIKRVKVFV